MSGCKLKCTTSYRKLMIWTEVVNGGVWTPRQWPISFFVERWRHSHFTWIKLKGHNPLQDPVTSWYICWLLEASAPWEVHKCLVTCQKISMTGIILQCSYDAGVSYCGRLQYYHCYCCSSSLYSGLFIATPYSLHCTYGNSLSYTLHNNERSICWIIKGVCTVREHKIGLHYIYVTVHGIAYKSLMHSCQEDWVLLLREGGNSSGRTPTNYGTPNWHTIYHE